MDRYRYGYRDYSASAHNNNDWTQDNYSAADHVYRPATVDVVKRETIVEHVNHPQLIEYKHSSPDYGAAKAHDFISTVQSEVSRPASATHWRQNGNMPNDSSRNGYHDNYSDYMEEPAKPVLAPSLMRPSHGDNSYESYTKPISTGNHNHNHNHNEDDYYKSSENSPPNYTDYYSNQRRMTKPTMATEDGTEVPYVKQTVKPILAAPITRHNHVTWGSPVIQDLSMPMNEIGSATEYLKEAAKPVVVDIDSREANRRYGRLSWSSPVALREKYTNTIDSREAAKKYYGILM